ncbi:hypothetical protein GGR51DRAFT_447742 [Nemania sp. FL0031]|nr:hypothetical protein GGR51DRAFT_447742 [Nemania sp. FL0031]
MGTNTLYLLILCRFLGLTMASFHNSFSDVALHSDILLEWDRVNSTYYPLVIRARVLNKTSEYNANTIEAEISSGLTDDSFLWRDLPFPLPFFSSATYELQVLGQQQVVGVEPELVIASSPSFTIIPQVEDGSNAGQTPINGTIDDPPESTNSPHSDGPPNSSTAIAAGLVVPFVVGLSVFVFLCMRRRQKRIDEERRKEREGLVID